MGEKIVVPGGIDPNKFVGPGHPLFGKRSPVVDGRAFVTRMELSVILTPFYRLLDTLRADFPIVGLGFEIIRDMCIEHGWCTREEFDKKLQEKIDGLKAEAIQKVKSVGEDPVSPLGTVINPSASVEVAVEGFSGKASESVSTDLSAETT